jgi:hypothetical protein
MTSEARIMRIKMKIQSLMDLIEEIELEEEEANESDSQEPVRETEQTTDDT